MFTPEPQWWWKVIILEDENSLTLSGSTWEKIGGTLQPKKPWAKETLSQRILETGSKCRGYALFWLFSFLILIYFYLGGEEEGGFDAFLNGISVIYTCNCILITYKPQTGHCKLGSIGKIIDFPIKNNLRGENKNKPAKRKDFKTVSKKLFIYMYKTSWNLVAYRKQNQLSAPVDENRNKILYMYINYYKWHCCNFSLIFLSPHIFVSKNKTERTYLNDT